MYAHGKHILICILISYIISILMIIRILKYVLKCVCTMLVHNSVFLCAFNYAFVRFF